jgi:hypothetical protein
MNRRNFLKSALGASLFAPRLKIQLPQQEDVNMVRFYLCPYGPGYIPSRPNARAAKLIQYLSGDDSHSAVQSYPWKEWTIVYVDAAEATHATIQADAEITLIPFWDSGDNYLPLSATVADVAQPYRSQIATFLENHRIPAGWISGEHTLGRIVKYTVQVFQIVQHLEDDFPEVDLSTQLSAINSAQRARVLQWLTTNGIETSDIDQNWSVRQLLQRIVSQYGWQPVLALGTALL